MVLKAGYYNKIIVHGEESGEVNVATLEALFDEDKYGLQAFCRPVWPTRSYFRIPFRAFLRFFLPGTLGAGSLLPLRTVLAGRCQGLGLGYF